MTPTTTVSLSTFIDSSPFWSSFLSQLLASLIVVIIGSLIAPPIINWFQRAKMEFWNAKSRWRSSKFEFVQDKDKVWRSIMYLVVKNLGRKTVERFYWSIYIDKNTTSDLVPKPPFPTQYTIHKEAGEKFVRYYGYFEMPIFPMDSVDFVFEVRLESKVRRREKIYYYFNTDHGVTPVWSWLAIVSRKFTWLKSLTIE